MKKMNIGLVGAGFMGKAHMVAFSNMPKLFTDAPFIPVFKTVCDIVPEIAEDFKERYGFETSAIVSMADVVEHLYNKPCNGEIVIDDKIKAAIDAYYEQYGAK